MNTVQAALLCAIAASCLACPAQNTAIPFKQIERDAQFSARLSVAEGPPAPRRSYERTGAPLETSSALVPSAYKPPRTFSRGFFLVNGLHLGAAMLDVGLTQHCIANNHCREGNPMMPASLSGQLGIDLGLVGYGSLVSYKMKKQDSKVWWLTPAIGIAAHTAGAATGIVNR